MYRMCMFIIPAGVLFYIKLPYVRQQLGQNGHGDPQ
jgi:hypothetical protein